ncbi:hypothetical protein IVB18_50555 (plasmid) [Bradyrhizobium sp. 186]|uniref:hypothetical protein n=1 Tax=Bradyrhizobium sp. 186 TaxID=2782654 RepID=UPI0020011CE3|nr:hypothetical protein [Bradyrhizobium sp. 186]UPK40866.1 hypothetical protein IVB18_50555 [Bradyrhizobium sp. 186]
MKYGSIEYLYASPIARAMIDDPSFRRWVLSKSEFAEFAEARILNREISAHRANLTAEWWRFHFTEKCRCDGCSGKETDLFTIFENKSSLRFALHFEVKQPQDKFKSDGIQSRGYPLRAQCWARKPPAKVLPHHMASTGIFFSAQKRKEYEPHLAHFKAQITFEEIEQQFPHLAVWPR